MTFFNDARIRARDKYEYFTIVSLNMNTAILQLDDIIFEELLPEENEPNEINESFEVLTIEVTYVYEVCDLCRGHGSHVNPSIDSHGLTREDFSEDPDFHDDYVTGKYNVTCYNCDGNRVVPKFDLPEKIQNIISEFEKSRAESRQYDEMERNFGA
jgi:hypothetical protein